MLNAPVSSVLTSLRLQSYTSVSDLALCTALLPVVRCEVRMLTC